MHTLSFLMIAIVSYLLGSIPFGYILVRVFRGEDVRLSGSGNIGATNVSRKSPVLGVVTLLLDGLKGAAAVVFASHFFPSGATERSLAMSLAALVAVLGHMFPVWLRFRGGKGVATALGSFVMIAPEAVLIAAGVFILSVVIFRFVSLGSILSVAVFPILAVMLREYGGKWVSILLMSAASALIIWKHRDNIRRLLAGTEPRLGRRTMGAESGLEKR